MVKVISFIFELLGDILSGLVEGIFDFLSSLFSTGRNKEYRADFLPENEIISRRSKGFCVNGVKCLSIEHAYRNCIIYGGSGAGKSSVVLCPSIWRMAGASSFIVHDPACEILPNVSAALIRQKYEVRVLNYSRPEISISYNPLARAKSSSDLQKIAKSVVTASLGSKSNDPFWGLSAENLITVFFRYLIGYAPKEYHNLANTLHMVNTFAHSPELWDRCMAQTDDQLISDYKSIVANSENTLRSIISSCKAALSIFGDPSVAAVTAADSLSIADFRDKKVALFINNSVKDMQYYSCLTSLFFSQIFGEIMSGKPGVGKPIFFLIDEASSLFISHTLQTAMSNIRKYNSGILQVYQDYNQLVNLYGQAEAKAINANAFCKVFMPGVPISMAEELSSTLGKFEYENSDGKRVIRQLLTPDEIRQLDSALIICGNKPAINSRLTPFYKQYKLRRLAKMPPYEPPVKQSSVVPLLKFD